MADLPNIDLSGLPDEVDLSNLPDASPVAQDAPQRDLIGMLDSKMGPAVKGMFPEIAVPVETAIDLGTKAIDAYGKKYGGDRPGQTFPAATAMDPNEPGLESPTGQKLIENANTVASGYFAPQLAKDVATLGIKGGKALVSAIKGGPKGLEEFIASAKAAKTAKAAEATSAPKLLQAPAPTPSKMNAPLMEEKGLEGPLPSLDDLKAQLMGPDVIKLPPISEAPKASTGLKIVPKGDSPIQEGPHAVFSGKGMGVDFYDIYNSPLNSASNVKVTLTGPEAVAKMKELNIPLVAKVEGAKGTPLALETPSIPAPKPEPMKIQFNKRQSNEIQKAIGKPKEQVLDEATNIKPSEPFAQTPGVEGPVEAPTYPSSTAPANPIDTTIVSTKPSKLPAGAEERLTKFTETTTPKFKAQNPLTQGSEIFKRAESTPVWREAAHAENTGVARSLEVKKGLNDLGIKPDSLESTALFHYIEHPNKGQAIEDLIRTSGKETARKIVTAERYIRKQMDLVLPQVNTVRASNGLAPITRMEDYITHMNESSILTRLNRLDLVGTQEGAEMAQGLNKAASELKRTKPNIYSKLEDVIFPYVKRKNEEYATDAAQSFQNYMDNAYRYIETQPYVNEVLEMAKVVEGTNPELASVLRDRAHHMAGGRSPIDKAFDLVIHPELVRFFEQLQRNAVGNVITFNPSVPLTQLQGLASTVGKYDVKDVIKATVGSFTDRALQEFALLNSEVLTTRALQAAETPLTSGPLASQWSKINAWFDYKVAEIAWMSSFKKAIQSMPLNKAVEEADLWAAATQGHKARVSTPPLQQSQVVQSIAPLMGQQVAAARSVLKTAIEGQGLRGKALATAKMAALLSAVSAIKSVALSREDTPFSLGDFLPYGPVLERGLGGPLLNSLTKVASAKSGDDRTRQAIRAGFLMQSKIPGGATVGKLAENFFMGKKKKGK